MLAATSFAAPPVIDAFTAEADPAGPRGARILRWKVLGASSMEIREASGGGVVHDGSGGGSSTIGLVPFGAVWKYLDDGSDQSNAWIAVSFDDSSWASGAAELGYGDPVATLVQSNRLDGSITVTVYGLLPNGNLMVRGEKWLTLNQGEEYVQVTGIVRPADVSTDNTVPSFKVADARITYSGKGTLADANKPGIVAKIFMRFFPL